MAIPSLKFARFDACIDQCCAFLEFPRLLVEFP